MEMKFRRRVAISMIAATAVAIGGPMLTGQDYIRMVVSSTALTASTAIRLRERRRADRFRRAWTIYGWAVSSSVLTALMESASGSTGGRTGSEEPGLYTDRRYPVRS